MPRDIPIGNGQLLVTFDQKYQIRDVYFPHVGQENHAGGGPCRFGVYTDVATNGDSELCWSDDPGWTRRQRYLKETLTTSVSMDHPDLELSLYCNDVVDFHRPVMVRRIQMWNLADRPRVVTLFHHHDFHLHATKVGDTAYYDPDLRSIIHYRKKSYLLATFFADGSERLDEYATGTSGFRGAEGTWRDAEDGRLSGNPIAQGAVDSTIGARVRLEPYGRASVYYVLGAGQSREDLVELREFVHREGPQGILDRTTAYWRLWVGGTNINFGNLSPRVSDLLKRSLLIMRTQIDNEGAIIAANDSEHLQFSRDTYSYMWPRDGALVASALDMAGFGELTRRFYHFCAEIINDEGYLLHKYNPDGSLASSWHPWFADGKPQLPIQEDETALVIWALWRHYIRFRDIEFVRPMWIRLIRKSADFMARFRDPATGLPLPSYDLWEERHGIHAFTVAAVYGGLWAARSFAICFGDRVRAKTYEKACEAIREGAAAHLYRPELGRFVRRLVPRPEGGFEVDETVDSALFGLVKFHMFDAHDERIMATFKAIEQKLWVNTPVGGVARYEDDHYHRISSDTHAVPGNPWFICTLWLAEYFIARARSGQELKEALPIFEWVAGHALESGVMAEQVDPYTNDPISVSPLTWSHASFVSVAIKYLESLEELQVCGECGQSIFRVKRSGPPRIAQQILVDEHGRVPESPIADGRGTAVARFTRENRGVTLAIDTRDCIGCGVCITHCQEDVLGIVDDKALVNLDTVDACTVCGDCERVCPVNVVTVREDTEPAAAPEPIDASDPLAISD